jgi:hypothetical protein
VSKVLDVVPTQDMGAGPAGEGMGGISGAAVFLLRARTA